MTFEEILDQAIELLQRRGRITYRALKRQFDLDDEFLEDLKVELIRGQKLAIDEGGEVLVWCGDAPRDGTTVDVSLAQASGPAQAGMPGEQASEPGAQASEPGAQASEPTRRADPSGERRQLTVMFCDLVESTSLSGRLDPEELRVVIRSYQRTCDALIQRYEGHVAQYLGDGILVYFGFPQAHEDDAQRAVRAALGILAAMEDLNVRIERQCGVRLQVRFGVHTGLVVIGAVGRHGHTEELALGETPNVAARIQGLAAPDTICISELTWRLVQGWFTCEDLGTHSLKGVQRPMRAFRVLAETAVHSRLDAARGRLTTFVGREREIDLLVERWQRARNGLGRVVHVSGEAGIGKSRLVDALRDRALADGASLPVFRCSPYHGNTPLHPVVEHLQHELDAAGVHDDAARLALLARQFTGSATPRERAIAVIAPLLSIELPADHPTVDLSSDRRKQIMFDCLVEWMLRDATARPVLALWDDLHWADPTTLELLGVLVRNCGGARMLILTTARPEFTAPWPGRELETKLVLERFDRSHIEAMIARLTDGKRLPAEVVDQVVQKTDGVPLFVEEITKLLLESGMLREGSGGYELAGPLTALSVPATLQDSLMARLDRLAMARTVAQIGSAIGREFSYELIRAVAQLDDDELQLELGRLVEAELLLQRGLPPAARYTFKHALVQDVAYESLVRSTRRRFHDRIAHVLEQRFPEVVASQPETLARHCAEAGIVDRAIGYWQRAGDIANGRSAHVEAIRHYSRGLELIERLPESPERSRTELSLQVRVGAPLAASRGYCDVAVEKAYERARALAVEIDDPAQVFRALYGLSRLHLLRAEYAVARRIGGELHEIARRVDDPSFLVASYRAMAATDFYLGEFAATLEHTDRVLDPSSPLASQSDALISDINDVVDPRVTCQSYSAWALWFLGRRREALARGADAIALAEHFGHPFSLALALNFATWLHQWCGDVAGTRRLAERALDLSEEQGFPFWTGWGNVLRGWALARQGEVDTGVARMRDGLVAWRANGSELGRAYFLTLLAEVLVDSGRPIDAAAVLDDATEFAERTGERFWRPEQLRVRGMLALRTDAPEVARGSFARAVAEARAIRSPALELRAALALARTLVTLGRREDAREALRGSCGTLDGAERTGEVCEALALLGEL